MTTLAAFEACDVCGRIPTELNEELACKIGQAFVVFLDPKPVCVGRDIGLCSMKGLRFLTLRFQFVRKDERVTPHRSSA